MIKSFSRSFPLSVSICPYFEDMGIFLSCFENFAFVVIFIAFELFLSCYVLFCCFRV